MKLLQGLDRPLIENGTLTQMTNSGAKLSSSLLKLATMIINNVYFIQVSFIFQASEKRTNINECIPHNESNVAA